MRSLKSYLERDEYLCTQINIEEFKIFESENIVKDSKERLENLKEEVVKNRKDYYLQANKVLPPKFTGKK